MLDLDVEMRTPTWFFLLLTACDPGGGSDGVQRTLPPVLQSPPVLSLVPHIVRDVDLDDDGNDEAVMWARAGATLTVTLDIDASQGLDLEATSVIVTGVPLQPAGNGVWTRVLDGTEGDGLKVLDIVLVDDIQQQVRVDAADLDLSTLGAVGFDFTPPQADCVVSPAETNATQDVTFRVASTEPLAEPPTVTPDDGRITLGAVSTSDDGRQFSWPVAFPDNVNFQPFGFDVTGTDEVGNPQQGSSFCAVADRQGTRLGEGPREDGDVVVTATPSVDDDGTLLVRKDAEVLVTIPVAGPDVVADASSVTLSGIDLEPRPSPPGQSVWGLTLTGDEGDGLKDLDARLFDATGNSARIRQDDVIRFDFTPPTATCLISPVHANGTDHVTLTVRASEALAAPPVPDPGAAALSVSTTPDAGPVYTYDLSVDQADVDYVLTIPATDLAGNDAQLQPSGENTLCVQAERTGSILAIGPSLTGEPVLTATAFVTEGGIPWVKADAEVRVTFPITGDVDPDRSTVTLSGTALGWDEANGWWEVALDGTEGDGPKDLQATLADAAGNPLPVVRDDVIRFDFTPPVADCVVTPDLANDLQDVRFDLFPSEALADGVAVTSSEVTLTKDPDRLRWEVVGPPGADTSYVLDVSATDLVGNVASGDALCPQADRDGRINRTLPTATAVTLSVSGVHTVDDDPPLAGDQAVVTVQIDAPSSLDPSETIVQIGEIPLTPISATTWQHTVSSTDLDGRKALTVELVDTAGNRAPAQTGGQAVVIDLTAPSAACTITPNPANGEQDVRLALTPTEPLAQAPMVSASTVSLGDPVAEGSRWLVDVDAPDNADTTYVLAVSMTDRVGNTASGDAVCPEADRTGQVLGVDPALLVPPVLTVSPSTYTDGTRPWAKAGDTVTVVLSPINTLDTGRTSVSVSGLALAYQGDDTWSVTLDGSEGDGLKDLRVQLIDPAENQDVVVIDDAVQFDFTAPTAACAVSPNPANGSQDLVVSVRPSEPLNASLSEPNNPHPVISVTGLDGFGLEEVDGRWIARRPIAVSDPVTTDLTFTASVRLEDRIGNVATDDAVCPEADRTGQVIGTPPALDGDPTLEILDGASFDEADAIRVAAGTSFVVRLDTVSAIDRQATSVQLGDLQLPFVDDPTNGPGWYGLIGGEGSPGFDTFDGLKTLNVRLVDTVGNATLIQRPDLAVRVDTTPPTTACTVSHAVANAQTNLAGAIAFAVQSNEALADDPSLTLTLDSSPAALPATTLPGGGAPGTGNLWRYTVQAPEDEDVDWEVTGTVTDLVGNARGGSSADPLCASGDHGGVIRGVLPSLVQATVAVVQGPSDEAFDAGGRTTVVGPGTELEVDLDVSLGRDATLDRAATRVQFGDLTIPPSSGTWRRTFDTADNDGRRTLQVVLVDDVGNTHTEALQDAIRVDTTPPSANCVLFPAQAKAGDEIALQVFLSEALLNGELTLTGADAFDVQGPVSTERTHTFTLTPPEDTDIPTYTLGLTAFDVVGNAQDGDSLCDLADRTGSVKGIVPEVIGTPTLEVTPAIDDDGTPRAKDGAAVLVHLVTEGPIDLTRSVVTVGGLVLDTLDGMTWTGTLDAALGDGPKFVSVSLVDAAGNTRDQSFPTAQLIADFTAPGVASTVLTRSPFFEPAVEPAVVWFGPVDGLTGRTVTGSLRITADEDLASPPALTFLGGPAGVDLFVDGSANGRVATWDLDTAVAFDQEGTIGIFATLEDQVGNRSTPQRLAVDLGIDTTPPGTDPDVDTPDRIVYQRAPWGSDASDGTPTFTVTGGPGAVPEGDATTVVLRARPLGGVLDNTAPDEDGSFSTLTASSDTEALFVGLLDRAGNPSESRRVRDVLWTGAFGLDGSSPHQWEAGHRFAGLLEHEPSWIQTPSASDGADVARADSVVRSTLGEDLAQERFTATTQAVVGDVLVDPATDVVASIDGNDGGLFADLRWWNGTAVREIVPLAAAPATIIGYTTFWHDTRLRKTFRYQGLGQGPGGLTVENELWSTSDQGLSWTREPDPPTPLPNFPSVAYDTQRGRAVLFGGERINPDSGYAEIVGETWEFDGETWFDRTSATGTAPTPSIFHAMAYDPVRDETVLIAGEAKLPEGVPFQDLTFEDYVLQGTWTWDGDGWSRRAPSHEPPLRYSASMTWDAAHQVLVFTGGDGETGPLYDTWTWDGSDWTDKTPSSSGDLPHAGTADGWFSPLFGQVLLADVQLGNAVDLDEIWSWDGADWLALDLASAHTPPGDRTPFHLGSFDVSDVVFDGAQARSVAVRTVTGGTGASSGGDGDGVTISVWDEGRWSPIGAAIGASSTPSLACAQTSLDATVPVSTGCTVGIAPLQPWRLTTGSAHTVHVALVPTHPGTLDPGGSGSEQGEVATDLVELEVRYRLPAED